jgi:hypothetical protein
VVNPAQLRRLERLKADRGRTLPRAEVPQTNEELELSRRHHAGISKKGTEEYNREVRRRRREANIYEKKKTQAVKSSARSAARRARDDWERELEQRVGGLGWRIRAPERLERRAARVGGGYRSRGGEYDWFYELHPAEQKRIRANWMSSSSSAPSPDEIEERIPMREWLSATRAIDMSRAVETGRQVSKNRYGGQTPESLIAGEPYDLRELHHEDEERAAHHVRRARASGRTGRHHVPANPHNVKRGIAYKEDGSLDVQFFTDSEGRVHPIRASYETMTPEERRRHRGKLEADQKHRDAGKVRYFNRATGTFEEYDYREPDNEAF